MKHDWVPCSQSCLIEDNACNSTHKGAVAVGSSGPTQTYDKQIFTSACFAPSTPRRPIHRPQIHPYMRAALHVFVALLSSPAAAQTTCFPGFSESCCEALRDVESEPAMTKAMWGLEGASGQAEASAFTECNATLSPCVVILPYRTQAPASCCTADAFDGWQAPGPAAAVLAVLTAAKTTHHRGMIWWVGINQTLNTAGGIVRKVISRQYPNWYPLQCDNATALGERQSMMCHGGSVIECVATVEH